MQLRTIDGAKGQGRTRLSGALATVCAAAMLAAGCGGGGSDATTYDVTVAVLSSTDLDSLHFLLSSHFNDGDWIGHGNDLDCTVLVDAALTSKHYGDGSLEIWLDNPTSFAVPADVIRCGARTAETLRDTSFDVTFLDATNFAASPTDASLEITTVEPRE